jgi:hypothetical protein
VTLRGCGTVATRRLRSAAATACGDTLRRLRLRLKAAPPSRSSDGVRNCDDLRWGEYFAWLQQKLVSLARLWLRREAAPSSRASDDVRICDYCAGAILRVSATRGCGCNGFARLLLRMAAASCVPIMRCDYYGQRRLAQLHSD